MGFNVHVGDQIGKVHEQMSSYGVVSTGNGDQIGESEQLWSGEHIGMVIR